MAFNQDTTAHLEELGGSDFEVVDGQPNVKGWPVKDTAGKKIGQITELLFSPGARKVRYLVVDLHDNGMVESASQSVLVPIGLAEIHEHEDEVVLPGVLPSQMQALPPYERGNVGPVTEAQTRSILLGTAVGDALAGNAGDFYSHEHFDMDKFYSSRMANVAVKEILNARVPADAVYSNEIQEAAANNNDELLMDYDELAGEENEPNSAVKNVLDDTATPGYRNTALHGGTDMNKYTGPKSKISEQLPGESPNTSVPSHDSFRYDKDEEL